MRRLLSSVWKRLRTLRPIEWLVSYIFGDDIFVSYSRRGGIRYAEQLTHVLSEKYGYSCRADFRQTRTGRTMPDELWRALRRSRTLVIIGSENALQSANVSREVEFYLQTHPAKMNIVPVDFEQKVDTASWFKLIDGVPPGPVESSSVLEAGLPSSHVLTRISESINFQRRNRRILYASATSLAIVLILMAVGGAASAYAAYALTKAAAAQIQAATATSAANSAQVQAAVALAQANASQAEAKAYQFSANEQSKLADSANQQRAVAEQATVRARKLEQDARANAVEQAKIANASRLAGRADRNIAQKPDLSLLLSSTALDAHPQFATLEVKRSLLTGLASYQRLDFLLRSPTGSFTDFVVTPDNKTLITISDELIFWDIGSRKARKRVPVNGLRRIILSGSGLTIAVMGERDVSIWDLKSESQRGIIRVADTDYFNSFGDLHPNKDVMVTHGRQGELVFWDFSDFNHISERRLRYDHGNIGDLWSAASIAFSPNGEVLLVGGAAKSDPGSPRSIILRWDVRDLAHPTPVNGEKIDPNENAVRELRFSPDGKYFLTTDSLNHVTLWNAKTLEKRSGECEANTMMYEPSFSADSSSFTTGTQNDGGITTCPVSGFWDKNDIPTSVGFYKRGVAGAAFSRDGSQIISLNLDGTIGFWRRSGLNALTTSVTNDERKTTSVAFSSDGKLLAVGDSLGRILITESAAVTTHGKVAATVLPPPENSPSPDDNDVLSLDFHPTRRILVAAYKGGAVVRWTWEATAGWQPSPFPVGDVPYTGTLGQDATPIASFVHFADEGRTLVSICKGSQVVLWNRADNLAEIPQVKAVISMPDGAPMEQEMKMARVVATRDGSELAIGYYLGVIHVLDVKSGQWLAIKGSEYEMKSVAISPDGRWLAAVDDLADGFLWRIESKSHAILCRKFKVEVDFPEPIDLLDVNALAFDRQNTTLAIGSSSTVTFWDVASTSTIGTLDVGMEDFEGLMFSPDGREVAAVGKNSAVLLNASPESWARVARHIANRELSSLELQNATVDASTNSCPGNSSAETTRKRH